MYDSKLIVLRGNSGSGKSTVAKKVREASGKPNIALVEQDYLRRFILKEKETEGTHNIDLIEQTVEFALARGYDVILEGGLYFPRYGAMLRRLAEKCPANYFFYFDVSLEETLRRDATRPNTHDEQQLREWYKPNQLTHFASERVIPEGYSAEAAVQTILAHASLMG